MGIHRVKGVLGAVIASSMMLSSTAALATAAPAQASHVDPWAVLTAMSGGAPAAAMCGSAAAAAATAAQPSGGCVLPVVDPVPVAAVQPAPPIVPVVGAEGGFGSAPLLLGLLAIVGGVGVYLAVRNNHHSNSPA